MSTKKSKVMAINSKSTEPISVDGQNLDVESWQTKVEEEMISQTGLEKLEQHIEKLYRIIEILMLFN